MSRDPPVDPSSINWVPLQLLLLFSVATHLFSHSMYFFFSFLPYLFGYMGFSQAGGGGEERKTNGTRNTLASRKFCFPGLDEFSNALARSVTPLPHSTGIYCLFGAAVFKLLKQCRDLVSIATQSPTVPRASNQLDTIYFRWWNSGWYFAWIHSCKLTHIFTYLYSSLNSITLSSPTVLLKYTTIYLKRHFPLKNLRRICYWALIVVQRSYNLFICIFWSLE